jgi:hypothetical protein
MFKNYLKTAWRNIIRNKAYAFISVFGLSLGITAAILIFTFVHYQWSFDNFHSNADRIYRIVSEYHYEAIEHTPGVPQPLGEAFRNDFTFAEKTARVRTYNSAVISLPGEKEVKNSRQKAVWHLQKMNCFPFLISRCCKAIKKRSCKNRILL